MTIGSPAWIDLIVSGAAQLGIMVSAAQAQAFALHGKALIQWNRKTNLTAIVDPEQLAVKHFLDAIAPLAHIPDQGSLIDVGTGGGFPGLPLKILRPKQPMTLIDGVRKKITFIKGMIRRLGLSDITALHARAEALGQMDDHRGRYAAVVCRAVADPDAVARMTEGLLAPRGRIIVYQGPNAPALSAPIDEHRPVDTRRRTVVAYRLPFTEDGRKVVILHG
jgi:16S rRNA (guanine527-N7)-methyltransferase